MLAQEELSTAAARSETPSDLPTDDELLFGLAIALSETGSKPRKLELVDRRPNPEASTFASERITCRVDGTELRLFCKYAVSRVGEPDPAAGLAYEIAVYRSILGHLNLATPRYYGSVDQGVPSAPWLVVESIEAAQSIDVMEGTEAVCAAAKWIGNFHRLMESSGSRFDTGFLSQFAEADCVAPPEWLDRLKQLPRGAEPVWWYRLVRYFLRLAPILAEDATVIHGDYYGPNVLFQQGQVRPLDWHTARSGPGVIDLAMLLEARPSSQVEPIVSAYRLARWGANPPADLLDRLTAARLWLHFRTVGVVWVPGRGRKWRLESLREEARELGFLRSSNG